MWVNFLVLIASVYVIIKAADYLVDGVGRYARKLGLSNTVAGFFIISISASFPELFSAVIAMLYGKSDMAVGGLIGNNMVHVALITGAMLLMGTLTLKGTVLEKSFSKIFPIIFAPFILMLDGELSRPDGVLLVFLFCYSFYTVWKYEEKLGKMHPVKFKSLWQDFFVFSGCLAAILMAARWLVFESVIISNYFNIPAYFTGLIIVGIGACSNDIAVVFKSIKAHAGEIALGDVIGSMLNDLVFFLGIAAIINPIKVNLFDFGNSFFWFVSCLIFLSTCLLRGKMTFKHGIVLLSAYLLFAIIEIYKIW